MVLFVFVYKNPHLAFIMGYTTYTRGQPWDVHMKTYIQINLFDIQYSYRIQRKKYKLIVNMTQLQRTMMIDYDTLIFCHTHTDVKTIQKLHYTYTHSM